MEQLNLTKEQIEGLSYKQKERLLELYKEKADRIKYNKIDQMDFYPWQKELANASKECSKIAAICANQIGKTTTGAGIVSYHATGLYPKWYKGRKFKKPPKIWACGVSSETTKQILQTELLGDVEEEGGLGSGMIPKQHIGEKIRRRGATGIAYESVMVAHHDPDTGKFNGWTRIGFKSYEMGEEKFMGRPMDIIWLDEQPEDNIYTQCITRTAATDGMVMMTFTPEQGMTKTVRGYIELLEKGINGQNSKYIVQAGWDDAPHITEKKKQELLMEYPPHERDMRSKGIPIWGSGMVYDTSKADSIKYEVFDIPKEWPRLAAIDFGLNDKTVVGWAALDPATNTAYLYDLHVEGDKDVSYHSSIIKSRNKNIPIVWPKDGNQRDKGTGIQLAQMYRDEGCNFLPDFFRNKITVTKEKGGQFSVEAGIQEVNKWINTGRLKVASHLTEWFEQFGTYHRKDGKIPDSQSDDIMDMTRYLINSIERWATIVKSDSYNNDYGDGDLPINDWVDF